MLPHDLKDKFCRNILSFVLNEVSDKLNDEKNMKFLVAFVLLASLALTNALICRECANARSEEECERTGIDRECPPGEADQCQIQIRYHGGWGPGYRIFKNCKQGRACDNNYIQNPRDAWRPTQCIPTFENSVCRCCCDTDRCNVRQNDCFSVSQKPQCPLPPSSVYYGMISCTNGREAGSVCTTLCSSGGVMRSGFVSRTYCRYDGSWSKPFGACARQQCEQRYLANGWYSFSDSLNAGSIATAQCYYGYDLIGPPAIRCVQGTMGTNWNMYGPVCQRRRCPDRGLIEGGVRTCENDFFTQSHCKVVCDPGSILRGVGDYYCQDDGFWSHDKPTCERVVCDNRGKVANGFVDCSNANNVDSSCDVTCDEGYGLVGDANSVCVAADGKGLWSAPLPVCELLQCPPRGEVANGRVRCNSGDDIGSSCTVRCDKGFDLTGDDVSACQGDATWDIDLPLCVAAPCRNQGRLRHGEISCSDDSNVDSVCTFTCTGKDYTLFPPTTDNNVCRPGGAWSRDKPCCSRPCPPYALMDLVIVLDSSSSIGTENWVLLTDFVASFLSVFTMSESAARISIFRYNGEVDSDTEILLGDFPGDKKGFIEKFRLIPYNGSGTKTGQALQYALDVHLQAANGNRPDVPDVVLLLTDGKSNDAVAAPAKAIRDTGAIVLAVGIEPPRGKLDRAELLEIAGRPRNVIVPKGGFENLNNDFALVLGKQVCGDECGNR